jgi:putative transposase
VRGRAFKITTIQDTAPAAAGLCGTAVHGQEPQPAVVADQTFVATWRGFVYVAFVIDVFSII